MVSRSPRTLGALPSLETLFKANDVSPRVQAHLARVFAALGVSIVATAAGAYVSYALVRVNSLVAFAAGLGMMLWLAMDADKGNTIKRVTMLCAFAALQVCLCVTARAPYTTWQSHGVSCRRESTMGRRRAQLWATLSTR